MLRKAAVLDTRATSIVEAAMGSSTGCEMLAALLLALTHLASVYAIDEREEEVYADKNA